MNGKILIDRKILDWEWWSDVNTARVFFYLILVASWKDTKWKGKEVKRGTVITSLASMAAGTNLTMDEVRTAIKHLLSTGEITKQSTSRNTLIYIVNYDLYQTLSQTDTKLIPSCSQTVPKLIPNCSQTVPKQIPTSEEYNKSKEGKKEINKYIVEIVEHLNEKTGKRYSAITNKTVEHINGRMSEGYTVDDFKRVIDNKCREWLGTDMEKFLRPNTLFAPSHFEEYLNQGIQKQEKVITEPEHENNEPELSDEEWVKMMEQTYGQ